MSQIIIREAKQTDYPAYFRMEQIAWKKTGIKPIDQDTFLSWLEVFPRGCLASHNSKGELVGLVASQICNFDPYSPTDTQKNFDQSTDEGRLVRSHIPQGNSLYIVTNSAIHPGAGYKMMSALCELTATLGKQYCVGSCRLPGLQALCNNLSVREPSRDLVLEYVNEIVQRLPKSQRKYGTDPVLSVLVKYPQAQIYDVVKNFLSEKDPQSMDWSCVMGWENPSFA